jgi:hypothetical protein
LARHRLVRGEEGSKRKHIPQNTLYEWRNQVERQVNDVHKELDERIRQTDWRY